MAENGAGTRGFTLIEMIVILVILSGLTAIAYPKYDMIYARVGAMFERGDLERQLLALPQRVRQSGRGGILASQSGDNLPDRTLLAVNGTPQSGNRLEQWQVLRITLPAPWRLRVPRPVFYHFSGACEGGRVTFLRAAVSLHYRLDPPLCRPIPIAADKG